MKHNEKNMVEITGVITSECIYSHSVFGENFYFFYVDIERYSGVKDSLRCLISDRLIDVKSDYSGCVVKIAGEFRSYNSHEEEKSKLVLSVFVGDIEFVAEDIAKNNDIYLDGNLCKPPLYRKTPLGREVADLLIAVNRPYGKSDYIPCIAWGRNARYVSGFEVGDRIQIRGRIQSRIYHKVLDDNATEKRVAYEVSASMVTQN